MLVTQANHFHSCIFVSPYTMREWNREEGGGFRCGLFFFLEKGIFIITCRIYLALFMGWFIGKAGLEQAWRSLSNLEVFNPRSDAALQEA